MIPFEIRLLLVFLTAFFSALFVLPKIANIAQKIGLVDHPGERKIHQMPKPLVGGIGMTIAATFSGLVFIQITGLRGFFLGLAVLLLVGFLDDFKEIGHRQKFLAQIAATTVMIYFSKTALMSFGDLFGLGSLDIPQNDFLIWCVTVFCVVGVINALNMIDGLDGLAGGISFIAFMMFCVHASLAGNKILMLLNLAFGGAVLGFLRFNRYPASLFMGDAGSLCLGFALAFMSLALTQGETANVRPIVALMILAVPITDTIAVMLKRILRGESPFKADQKHLHHTILRYGFSRNSAVTIILGISFLLSCLSLLGPIYGIPDYWLFFIFSVYFCSFLFLSFYGRLFRQVGGLADRLNLGEFILPIRRFINKNDYFHISRKAERYQVGFNCVCRRTDTGESFRGLILDISAGGFMACFKHFPAMDGDIDATIFFPADQNEYSVCIPVKHIWKLGDESEYFCGFKFLEFDGEQSNISFQLRVINREESAN